MGYAAGFLEGTCSHAVDLVRGGLHAYAAFGPLPLQVFFVALVALDPSVVVLTLRARPAGVRLAGVVMTLDVLAHWYVNWPWAKEDWTRLPRPVGRCPSPSSGCSSSLRCLCCRVQRPISPWRSPR
ncbi:hypothetical protein SRB17_55820 [Streptomyces sp. RB17]|nr:hypothetical protein [Streptomyces sp. RB17]